MKREALQDSVARQEQNENLTEAVLDFVEGIGIIKTYNLLGEKSRELTDNFQRSCDTSLQFEEDHSPWQLRLNLAYGLGAAAITAIALALESAGLMSVPYLVGIMLFVFDLFGPIKALYTQATRLTVMNSCMDRIEAVFHEPELPDDGRTPSRRPARLQRWSSSVCALPMGRKRYSTTSPSPCPGTRCWPW